MFLQIISDLLLKALRTCTDLYQYLPFKNMKLSMELWHQEQGKERSVNRR